jgi:hypothetical protein
MTDTERQEAPQERRTEQQRSDASDLDTRYGRGARSRRVEKRVLWWLGGVIVVVFAAWVVLVAFDGDNASLEARDVAHTIVDEHTVEVSFSLNVAPGTPTVCAVQALNEAHAIVGWKIVEIPASGERNRVITETVRTSEQSNTGLISRCWLP